MATHHSSFGELTAMSPADLRKDVKAQRTLVAKMRLQVEMQKEKDTAKLRREKKMLARMLTALDRVESGASAPKNLKKKPKSSTVSSRSAPEKK